MKIIKKILFILLISVLILMANNSVVFADGETGAGINLGTMEDKADSFINYGKENSGDLSGVTDSIVKNFTGLGQILTFIGAGVMVAVVSYMGIKYLISPPDKQGALKQQLIGVVVAGIVIFGAYGIWSSVLKLVSKF